jgi:hypothetical protein
MREIAAPTAQQPRETANNFLKLIIASTTSFHQQGIQVVWFLVLVLVLRLFRVSNNLARL